MMQKISDNKMKKRMLSDIIRKPDKTACLNGVNFG